MRLTKAAEEYGFNEKRGGQDHGLDKRSRDPADAIREKLKWKPGTELNVEETPNGVLLTPTRYFAPTKLEDVAGMLRHKVRIDHPLSIEEMDAAIMAEARRRARDRYEWDRSESAPIQAE